MKLIYFINRTGLASTRARQLWWPILVKTGYKQSVENIPDISGLARKRYTWAMKSLTGSDEAPDVNLDWDEAPQQEIAEQVMQLLNRQYHMPEPGLVVPFVNFASSILTNKAICFSFCCDFMDRPVSGIFSTVIFDKLTWILSVFSSMRRGGLFPLSLSVID